MPRRVAFQTKQKSEKILQSKPNCNKNKNANKPEYILPDVDTRIAVQEVQPKRSRVVSRNIPKLMDKHHKHNFSKAKKNLDTKNSFGKSNEDKCKEEIKLNKLSHANVILPQLNTENCNVVAEEERIPNLSFETDMKPNFEITFPLLRADQIKKEIIETDSSSASESSSSDSSTGDSDEDGDSTNSSDSGSSDSESDSSSSSEEDTKGQINQKQSHLTSKFINAELEPTKTPLILEEYTVLPYKGKKRGPKRKKPLKIRDPNKPMRKRPGQPWVPIECPHCDKTFRYISQLRQHSTAHNRERPFYCNECGKTFKRNCQLQEHRTGHTTPRVKGDPLCCSFCEKPCLNSYELKLHIRTHTHEKPFTCHLCDRSFSVKRTLKIHLRRHAGEKPFKCTQKDCDKAFTVKLELQRHMRIHTGEKRAKCNECGKRFSHVGILKSHILIHEGILPFQCPFCDACFRQSNNLDYHVRVHKF